MAPLDDATQFENNIPEAVRRQSARADDFARVIGARNVGGEDTLAGAGADTVAGGAGEDTLAGAGADSVSGAGADTVVGGGADTVAGAVAPTDWEQRYRTLQGKYDSEVPQLLGQVSALERLLSQLQRELDPAPAAPATTTTVVIPESDVEEYGPDLIARARAWARAEVAPEIDELRRRVDDLTTGHQRVETRTVQEGVNTQLDADPVLAGKWRSLNNDPEFLTWVSQADPFAGRQRLQLLREAHANGEAVRVGNFFKAFIREHTAVAQPAVTEPAPHPAPAEAGAGRPSLEDLAAPGRPNGSASIGGAPAEKRVWTNRDISAFYRDVTAGRYNGREADKVRTEADIIAAATEGRVRP